MASAMQTRGFASARNAAPVARLARGRCVSIRCSVAATETSQVIHLADREAFRALLKDANDNNKVLLVDYFTTWCGPCKLIAPEVEKMAAEFADRGIQVAKVTCDASNDNKRWAMDIQIKSLPTFRVYRDGNEKEVGQVTGARMSDVRQLIEDQLTGTVPVDFKAMRTVDSVDIA